MDHTFIKIKCPHCGYKFDASVNANEIETAEIRNCNKEIGGCGKDFAFAVEFAPLVYTSKLDFQEQNG